MNIALVGPGIMEIPPKGWGAVESLIWDYATELGELGHEGTIINTPDRTQIIRDLCKEKYDYCLFRGSILPRYKVQRGFNGFSVK